MQARGTLVDVLAHQPVALVAHTAHAGEVVANGLHTLSMGMAPAARRLTVPQVSN